jgi:hypothetical protein
MSSIQIKYLFAVDKKLESAKLYCVLPPSRCIRSCACLYIVILTNVIQIIYYKMYIYISRNFKHCTFKWYNFHVVKFRLYSSKWDLGRYTRTEREYVVSVKNKSVTPSISKKVLTVLFASLNHACRVYMKKSEGRNILLSFSHGWSRYLYDVLVLK